MSADARRELVDHVDEHDRVVGVVSRGEMRDGTLWHRAVYVLVLDSRGRILLQQRSFDKDMAAGHWDIGAGGVVAAGESYDDAAVRELAEELGVTDVVVELLGPCRFEHSGLRVHGRAYRVVHDGPFAFHDGEVIGVEWVHADDLDRIVAERRFVPDAPEIFFPWTAELRTRPR